MFKEISFPAPKQFTPEEAAELETQRAAQEEKAQFRADLRNAARPLSQRLFQPSQKVKTTDVMMEEAEKVDQIFDQFRLEITKQDPSAAAQDILKEASEATFAHPDFPGNTSLSLIRVEEYFLKSFNQFSLALEQSNFSKAAAIFENQFSFTPNPAFYNTPECQFYRNSLVRVKVKVKTTLEKTVSQNDANKFFQTLQILKPIINKLENELTSEESGDFKIEKFASAHTTTLLKEVLFLILERDPHYYPEQISLFQTIGIFSVEGFASLHRTQELVNSSLIPHLILQLQQLHFDQRNKSLHFDQNYQRYRSSLLRYEEVGLLSVEDILKKYQDKMLKFLEEFKSQ